MEAVVFAALCKSTVNEQTSLRNQLEIVALQAVQFEMLSVLRERATPSARNGTTKAETCRRVQEAIAALEGALGITPAAADTEKQTVDQTAPPVEARVNPAVAEAQGTVRGGLRQIRRHPVKNQRTANRMPRMNKVSRTGGDTR